MIFDPKTGKRHPVHLNRNDRIRDFLNGERDSLVYLSNAMMNDHWAKLLKLYFTADGDPSHPETLVALDADAHEWGTVEACVEFLKLLNKRFRLHGYIEPSPRGAHLYFVLFKLGCNAQYLKDLFRDFQIVLRDELRKAKADVQGIEVKGTVAIITWNRLGRVTNVVAGVPCTIPEEKEAFDLWRQTYKTVRADRLRRHVDRLVPKVKPESVPEKRRLRKTGSVSGCAISQDELDQLNGHYRDVAKTLLQEHKLKAGACDVTVEDMASFLLLLKFFTNNMNSDGSLPWARWEGMWSALHKAKDITRAFDPKRLAVMRNYVSSFGLIDWKDNSYIVGGPCHSGRAMKWRASERLLEMLEVPTVQENKKASLSGTKVIELIRSLVGVPESETIRPQKVSPPKIVWWNGDEITRFLETTGLQLAS